MKKLFKGKSRKALAIVSVIAILVTGGSTFATYKYLEHKRVEQINLELLKKAEKKEKARKLKEKMKLKELRENNGIDGIAVFNSDKYAAVITDDEKSMLLDYEERMMTTHKVEEFEKFKAEFDNLVAQLDTRFAEWNAEQQRIKEEEERKAREAEKAKHRQEQTQNVQYSGGGNIDLRSAGVVNWGGYRFTWYSQNVLPGGGLNIPGRHVNGAGFVCDGDGYIVAATAFGRGTTGNSPWGAWKSYDTGVSGNTVDLYTSW